MRLFLIHQHDPTAFHVGGIGTFLNTLIRYAPQNLEINLVGITADPGKNRLGQWQNLHMGKKEYRFLPIVAAKPPYQGRIPLSLQFTWALSRFRKQMDLKDAILQFQRIEPALIFRNSPNQKILFLHGHMNDLYNAKTEVKWKSVPSVYFFLENWLIPRMNRVFIVREDAIQDYKARFQALHNHFFFLPTWVDDHLFTYADDAQRKAWQDKLRSEQKIPDDARILLFIGRFEGQKDPLMLLEAFSHLNGQAGQAALVLIGAGKLENSMRNYIQAKSLDSKIRILSPKRQEELVAWMNVADCLCLSSAFEGMPRVVVEALQCGLPVVSTNAGEAKRLIREREAGRVVLEHKAEAMSQAILETLKQPRNPLVCQRQVKDFKAEAILSELYQYYHQLKK